VFRVIAANSDGVWNTNGQSLAVVVLPPFYRTSWFLALASLIAACTVVLAWRSPSQRQVLIGPGAGNGSGAHDAAVNCEGCQHCHYTTARQNNVTSRLLQNEKDKFATDLVPGRSSNDLPTRQQELPSLATNSTARYRGREREIVMEASPEGASVRLLGTRTRYQVSWRAIFDLAPEIRARRERELKRGERRKQQIS